MTRPLFLIFLAGLGCAPFASFEPYYENWSPPSVTGFSVASEKGNIGGGITEILGSGFGTDLGQVVVQFGDANAEIISIADGVLEVRVPKGPITGGGVDVIVSTPTGYATSDVPYVYDVGDLYAEQIGHIQINNFWESCLGGQSERFDPAIGCGNVSYIGYTGIDGVAEALTFVYPRLHAENIGFLGGTDQASSEWVIERPGQNTFASGVEDLHRDLGTVTLENDLWAGDAWCPELDQMASYRYGGGREEFPEPVSLSAASILAGRNCDIGDEGAEDMETMEFCTTPDQDGVVTHVYAPNWPIAKNFFAGKKNDHTVPGTITIRAPEMGIEGLEVRVPESVIPFNEQGFAPVTAGGEGGEDLWSVTSLEGCFDDEGGAETLDDVALRFSWDRSAVSAEDGTFACEAPGELCAQSTYVRLTLTSLSLNWFGTIGYPVRATIVVPDGVPREPRPTLDVPASVLYQFPTARLPQTSGGLGETTIMLDSTVSNWGYLLTTFERVTDYSIRTNAGGTVVFSYTTGDFGFFGWDNPTEAGACENCLDDDRDGWSDADDPDCATGGVAETGFGATACNDGIDNDGDGRTDSGDTQCTSAKGNDESNCSNGIDDDADGLEDLDDPDCLAGGNEGDTGDLLACADGIDGDEDGWTDLEDPDCLTGDEELGFGTSACNDNVDNDGDLAFDALDPECSDAADDDESA